MRDLRSLGTGAALVAVLALAPTPAHGANAVLGNEGRLYRLAAGPYGELFPEGAAAEADAAVLALDVLVPGETAVRRLVPGSEGTAADLSPMLVFEPASATTFVVWERRGEGDGSALLMAGVRGDEWIGPVELSGDAAPLKRAPTVLITRDELWRPTVTEGRVRQSRTILHVVWWEQSPEGEAAVLYTPVVLADGAYVGWNPVYRLDALDPNEPVAEAGAAPELFRSPELSPGTDLSTLMIAFGNPATGRLLTVQARVLPGELGLLADRIPEAVVAAGYAEGEDRLKNIRGILRSQIIEIGNRFNPGVVQHLADASVAAAEHLHAAQPERPIDVLGDDLRSQIIEIGATVLGGVDRPTASKASRVLEVRRERPGDPGAADGVLNLVQLRLVRDLPLPEAVDGPARIYSAGDGTHVLVSWENDSGVVFTESLEERAGTGGAEEGAEGAPAPWTEPRTLELGETALDAAEVDTILRARVSQRP